MIRYAVKHVTRLSLSALLALACLPATAQTPPNIPDDCAEVNDGSKRLACYDAFFQHQAAPSQTTVATPTAPTSKPNTPRASTPPVAQAPRTDDIDAFGKKEEHAKKVKAIDVEVTEAYKDLYGKWVFVTTNSQVWRQTDINRSTIPNLPSKATIKRGAMGGFMLSFEGRKRSIRVKRAD